ncbi:MAG: M20 family metallopeptidase [Planctomycetes bacterium]|nr:M20 family metallopeptidase [Planctomycetota bacterium]
MLTNPVELLEQLIAIPSVNPACGVFRPEICGETRLTEFLERTLRQFRLETMRQPIEPGRDNLLAKLPAGPDAKPGTVLLLEAHQDTVSIEGMTVDPFIPTVRDGRVFGRGACDVKGGLAAVLAAVARLAQERPPNMPAIVVACTVNEEAGFSGAQGLAEGLRGPLASFLPGMPTACIVAEPTELVPVVAHRGVVRWRSHTTGRAAHSSEPSHGDNAIYKMARLVTALQTYAEVTLPQSHPDPFCGGATLSVGTIQGGSGVNTVPDSATIEIDHRTLPQEDPRNACRKVQAFLANRSDLPFEVRHDPPHLCVGGLNSQDNGDLAAQLIAAGAAGPPVGVAYSTNATAYAAVGIPTLVFGPGSIAQAHTADEWIAIEQLHAAVEILVRLGGGAT